MSMERVSMKADLGRTENVANYYTKTRRGSIMEL